VDFCSFSGRVTVVVDLGSESGGVLLVVIFLFW
jgi:hypothetical protein